jgi:hypothetical protein
VSHLDVLNLNDANTGGQDNERDPLHKLEATLQNGDHKNGSGQNLDLEGDLEDGRVQIRYGQIDQVVLDGEEQGGYAGLDRVQAVLDDLRVDLVLELGEAERLAVEQDHGGAHLDHLLAHNGCGGEEHVARDGAHVAEQDDRRRVLYDQNGQTDPFQVFVFFCEKKKICKFIFQIRENKTCQKKLENSLI